MSLTRDDIMAVLRTVTLPDGTSLSEGDRVRALEIKDGTVRFVLEAPDSAAAQAWSGAARFGAGQA